MVICYFKAWILRTKVMNNRVRALHKQERLAVASIARDDSSTFPRDDPFPRAD